MSDVEEDMVAIRITPTTPVTVLIYEIYIRISAVLIGIIFRYTVEHILDFNAFVQRLVEDTVMTEHLGAWPWQRMADLRNWY